MLQHKPEATSADTASALQRGHEFLELDTRYIGWFAVGIVALLIVSAAAAFGMLGGFRVSPAPQTPASQGLAPGAAPVPRLQSAPAADLRAFRVDQAAALEQLRWLDREHGIVQIPIERAMQRIAAGAETSPAPSGTKEKGR